MGMSASQARYLSLTARKSDLEFRGQQINQSRLMLSNQSANLYSSMLSMSVPTPPVETDFMKDVYSFSMNGDNTTLSSYKLSMGKDGYGYDILYSKPASTQQLTASTTSEVQKSVTRKASQGSSTNSYRIKIKTSYDDSTPQPKTPNVSRLVSVTSTPTPIEDNKNFQGKDGEIYTNFWAYLAADGSNNKTQPKNPSYVSSGTTITNKDKITFNECDNTATPTKLTYNEKDYNKVSKNDLTNIFGCTFDTSNTYKFTDGGALKNIIGENAKLGSSSTSELSAYQFYINADEMKLMVINTAASSDGAKQNMYNNKENGKSPTLLDNAVVKEYDLAAILGLSVDSSISIDGDQDKKVYYIDSGNGSSSKRSYYTFSMGEADEDSCKFQYCDITGEVDRGKYKIDDNELVGITPEDFGITKNNNVVGGPTTSDKEYQYFRDSSTGDIWELCTTTSTSGTISESWKLFEPNKTATINDKEAQFIDETDWPTGISHTQQNGEYDCYYVPDDTGTGGSYYLIAKNDFEYGNKDSEDGITSSSNATQYEANNTYKIEGMTACVVNEDNVPSTIADAYDLDDYIIYATYDDSDTDFSNPIKYYVFPKDEDDANAVCSYAYEKSYTGKNEILEGRANILVDENGRLSKLNIAGVGTYALEYGQEIDQDAYDEAYKEYEFKLQKYEKEIADIDAKTATIQQQDKKLELQLKSIDTEHSAIQTELEALKKVIDTNVKSSFGTFGG